MPELTTTYDRPVEAKLFVHLDNGETFEATAEDLAKFKLVNRLDAYKAFSDVLTKVLTDAGLLDYDDPVDEVYRQLTDAEISPLRYLIETVLNYPQLLDHPDHEGWKAVADLERRLRLTATVERLGETATDYDGKTLAQIIDDFVLVRGDLSEAHAREQLARAVQRSAEVNALVATARDGVNA